MVQYSFGQYDPIGQGLITVQGVFTKEECEKIIQLGKNLENACIGDESKNNGIRKSKIDWINVEDETKWIFDRMAGVILDMNEQIYRFDLTGFQEGFQLTKYDKGDLYREHMDAGVGGVIPRKLSAVVQLTDESTYEGGNLELICGSVSKTLADRKQGSVTIFPSFFVHRVNEVTKGTRYSLVSWVCGPQFK